MNKTFVSRFFLYLLFVSFFYHSLSAIIGPVIPGQSLWCINQRIASEVDNIESKLDHLCHATMITEPTTITQEGAYCLGNEIVGSITIASSNVDLDLSNRRITDGIIVNGDLDQITIENGTVEGGSDAIFVGDGTHNVTIHDVTVKNGSRGIGFQGVTDSVISNCEMTFNTTGLELITSRNITVKNCVASSNIRAGYSLISSSTNTFENCTALNTGQGNTAVTNTSAFGFVAQNGRGNVFEQCIANATQALTTTDQNSLVAGFAVRGTENCTKIIGCEAANGTTSSAGVTVPIGILLESRFDGLVTVTSVNPGSTSDSIHEVAWSPDGKYVAVGGDISFEDGGLFLYRFDRVTQGLTLVEVEGPNIEEIQGLAWSPDGLYLAVGGQLGLNDFAIFKFDHINETLTDLNLATGETFGGIGTIDWSPNGKFIAIGTISGSVTNRLFVTRFNSVTEQLEGPIIALNPDAGPVDSIRSVDWSPDGLYLAVAGVIGDVTGNDLFIYKFNESLFNLTPVTSINPGGGTIGLGAARWSPNGKYLAVEGANTAGAGNDLFMYRFNRTTETLIEVDSVNPDGGSSGDQLFAMDWSPDGTFLAVGGLVGDVTGNDLFVYKFDQGTERLTEVNSINPDGGSTSDFVLSIDWSPDGQYLAMSGQINGITNNDVFVFRALQFPQDNVIKNNKVYCNSGNKNPEGVGISGSSICNLIVDNTAYANPVNPPIVGSNYWFVTNVFTQSTGSVPSPLQNVSLATCEPPCNPVDLELLIKQNINKTTIIIESLACGAQPLKSSDIIGGVITLSTPGNYCLSTDLITDIDITSSCVSLDLNDRCLTGVISISDSDEVVVKNGYVTPASPVAIPNPGISIAQTANNVTIDGVNVICADTGTGFALDGRVGIATMGNDVHIINCTIRSGSAGAMGGGATGQIGGDGIQVNEDANRTLIKNCTILLTGSGGEGDETGGRAGHGIAVGLAGTPAFTEIINCIVFATGNGGRGEDVAGGDGGHAIFIGEGAIDTAVRNCTLRNTGVGGTSNVTAGTNGRAVQDLQIVTADLSMVFSNFAHNIANSIKYNIQNTGVESGVLTPNPPTSTVINPLANVFAS